MSNRKIKAEFWEDEDLLQLPRDARWLFEGLWHLAEDSGCVKDEPFLFKTKLFPSPEDADLTVQAITEHRDRLVEDGFLVPYEVDGRRYLFIATFHEHQTHKNKNAPREYPLPPWLKWEPYPSNPRAGKYVVSSPSDERKNDVSQPSDDRRDDVRGSRLQVHDVTGSVVEGEEREEGEWAALATAVFGVLDEFAANTLRDYVEHFGEELVAEAMRRTVANAERNRRQYLKGIFVEWDRQKVFSLERLREVDADFEHRKHTNRTRAPTYDHGRVADMTDAVAARLEAEGAKPR